MVRYPWTWATGHSDISLKLARPWGQLHAHWHLPPSWIQSFPLCEVLRPHPSCLSLSLCLCLCLVLQKSSSAWGPRSTCGLWESADKVHHWWHRLSLLFPHPQDVAGWAVAEGSRVFCSCRGLIPSAHEGSGRILLFYRVLLLSPATALASHHWPCPCPVGPWLWTFLHCLRSRAVAREDDILTEEILESCCLGWNSGPLLTRCVRLYLTGLLWGFSELIHIKCLSQGLAYTKYSVTLLSFQTYWRTLRLRSPGF